MTDPRYRKLAKLLVEYSTALKKGDRVLLDMIDVPDEFAVELMRAARAVGATPIGECPDVVGVGGGWVIGCDRPDLGVVPGGRGRQLPRCAPSPG